MSDHSHRPSGATGAGAEGDGSDRRPAAGKVARTGKLAAAPGSTASTATPRAASVQRQAAPASHEDPFGMHLLGGPDTSTPLPTRGADTLADAHDHYLGAHWDRLRAASQHHFASHLGRWNVPRLSWSVDDARRAQAITAAIFPSLHIAGQLEALVAPEPLAPAIALGLATQAHPGEGDGDPTWNPMVGVAVSRLLERRLAESMARMGARYVAAYDAREGEVVASDLPRSDAMDGVAARLLSDDLVRLMGPVPQSRRDRTPRRPKEWRWLGGQDASLWNWIEVTDPPNASLEDVALLLPADVPPIVEGDGRFFRMPEDWARNQPAAGAHAPRLGTVATGLELASSTRAVDAAIAQADDVKPQKASAAQLDARAERIAGDLHQIVAMLGDAHAERVVPAFVSLGAIQSEKRDRRGDVARVLFGQEELLKEILVEIERFTHVAHARGHSRESGPVQGVLLELALAAGNSHLHDVGRQHLATARKRAADVGRRLAEEAVAAHGGGAIDLAEAGGAGADDARERQRARFDALDSSAPDPGAIDVEASIDAFLLHTRAVDQQLDTMMSALLATNDRLASIIGMPWVTEAEELARAVATVRDKARNVHVWLSERLAETHDASARRALLDRAKSALAEQIAATEIMDLSRRVASMLARVDDADRIIQLVNMTLQTLAISVVATGAGMFVTAAAAPTTALGRLGVATAGAVTEATVAGTLQTLLFNDNPGDALAENLLGSLMSIAVLRGFHKVTEQYGPFTAENIALWERLGSRANVAVLRATHLTVEMALGAGAGYAAVHIVRSPVTPTEDEGLQWAMQGASIVAGHWISRRMVDARGRIEKTRAGGRREVMPQIEKALADIEALRSRADAATTAPLDPNELRALFAEQHRVLVDEATVRGGGNDPAPAELAAPTTPRDRAVALAAADASPEDISIIERVITLDETDGPRLVREYGAELLDYLRFNPMPSKLAPLEKTLSKQRERITGRVEGFFEGVDTTKPPDGWKFQDRIDYDGYGTKILKTDAIGPNGAHGYFERGYNASRKELELRMAFLRLSGKEEAIPSKVAKQGDNVEMIAGEGSPTVQYITLYQLKKLGVPSGHGGSPGIERVHLSDIQNIETIVHLHWLRSNAPGEIHELIAHTASVKYAETTAIQSGYERASEPFVSGGQTSKIDDLMKFQEGTSSTRIKEHDAILKKYGFTRDTEMLWGFDIDFTTRPAQ